VKYWHVLTIKLAGPVALSAAKHNLMAAFTDYNSGGIFRANRFFVFGSFSLILLLLAVD